MVAPDTDNRGPCLAVRHRQTSMDAPRGDAPVGRPPFCSMIIATSSTTNEVSFPLSSSATNSILTVWPWNCVRLSVCNAKPSPACKFEYTLKVVSWPFARRTRTRSWSNACSASAALEICNWNRRESPLAAAGSRHRAPARRLARSASSSAPSPRRSPRPDRARPGDPDRAGSRRSPGRPRRARRCR